MTTLALGSTVCEAPKDKRQDHRRQERIFPALIGSEARIRTPHRWNILKNCAK